MSEWKTYRIKDVAKVIGGGTPKTNVSEYWYGDIPWITPKDLTTSNKIFISRGERNITKLGLEESSAQLLPKGTVLLTSRAPIGCVAIASNKLATNQGFKSLICNEKLAYNVFIYYWLIFNKEYLNSIGTGTTFAEISGSVVKDIEISLPTLFEQKAIAGVLSSLDDKIDLLHRQNKTLEEMAETIFRQWFIEEAENDWEEVRLKDIVELQSGYPFKSKSFRDTGEYKIITIKAVQDGYLEPSNADRIDEIPNKMPAYCFLNIGDILLSLTGNVGRCCIVDENKLLLNQRVAKIKPKRDMNTFAYIFFRRSETRSQLIELAKGTAQLNLSPIETSNIRIKLPSKHTLGSFNDLTNPVLNRIIANKLLIKNITRLRNTLLPKLMSGEARVELE